jgi:hypothetical protein
MILAGCPWYVSFFQTLVNFVAVHAVNRIDTATIEAQKDLCMVLMVIPSLSWSLVQY